MNKLKELERRLRDEPDNLGLRVVVAGALHEAGRRDDAIELYRSVALVYREQGRTQQAITVCRSILELAPDDVSCRELIDIMIASQSALPRSALPPSLREEFDRYPQIAGIADAAREVSEALIAASPDDDEADLEDEDEDVLFDLDTRRILRSSAAEPAGHFAPPAMVESGGGEFDGEGDDDPRLLSGDGTPHVHIDDDDERSALSPVNGVPHVRIDGDERPTRSPARGVPRAPIIDDEKTARRERPSLVRPPDKE